jgi:hypothetical protein
MMQRLLGETEFVANKTRSRGDGFLGSAVAEDGQFAFS